VWLTHVHFRLMAPNGHAATVKRCLLLGVEPTSHLSGATSMTLNGNWVVAPQVDSKTHFQAWLMSSLVFQ
jgi:hypothetical protein